MVNIAKGANKLRFSADSFPFVNNRFELTDVVNDYQYFMPYQHYFGIFYVDSRRIKFTSHMSLQKGKLLVRYFLMIKHREVLFY